MSPIHAAAPMHTSATTRKTRACAALALCIALALQGACSTPQPKVAAAPQPVQDPGKVSLSVNASNDGASVVLGLAQGLRVDLPTDATAVNADLVWYLSQSSPGLLDASDPVFQRGPRDNNPADAGGTTIWRFRPRAAGRDVLTFELRKPHRLDPPVRTLHYDVTVR